MDILAIINSAHPFVVFHFSPAFLANSSYFARQLIRGFGSGRSIPSAWITFSEAFFLPAAIAQRYPRFIPICRDSSCQVISLPSTDCAFSSRSLLRAALRISRFNPRLRIMRSALPRFLGGNGGILRQVLDKFFTRPLPTIASISQTRPTASIVFTVKLPIMASKCAEYLSNQFFDNHFLTTFFFLGPCTTTWLQGSTLPRKSIVLPCRGRSDRRIHQLPHLVALMFPRRIAQFR